MANMPLPLAKRRRCSVPHGRARLVAPLPTRCLAFLSASPKSCSGRVTAEGWGVVVAGGTIMAWDHRHNEPPVQFQFPDGQSTHADRVSLLFFERTANLVGLAALSDSGLLCFWPKWADPSLCQSTQVELQPGETATNLCRLPCPGSTLFLIAGSGAGSQPDVASLFLVDLTDPTTQHLLSEPRVRAMVRTSTPSGYGIPGVGLVGRWLGYSGASNAASGAVTDVLTLADTHELGLSLILYARGLELWSLSSDADTCHWQDSLEELRHGDAHMDFLALTCLGPGRLAVLARSGGSGGQQLIVHYLELDPANMTSSNGCPSLSHSVPLSISVREPGWSCLAKPVAGMQALPLFVFTREAAVALSGEGVNDAKETLVPVESPLLGAGAVSDVTGAMMALTHNGVVAITLPVGQAGQQTEEGLARALRLSETRQEDLLDEEMSRLKEEGDLGSAVIAFAKRLANARPFTGRTTQAQASEEGERGTPLTSLGKCGRHLVRKNAKMEGLARLLLRSPENLWTQLSPENQAVFHELREKVAAMFSLACLLADTPDARARRPVSKNTFPLGCRPADESRFLFVRSALLRSLIRRSVDESSLKAGLEEGLSYNDVFLSAAPRLPIALRNLSLHWSRLSRDLLLASSEHDFQLDGSEGEGKTMTGKADAVDENSLLLLQLQAAGSILVHVFSAARKVRRGGFSQIKLPKTAWTYELLQAPSSSSSSSSSLSSSSSFFEWFFGTVSASLDVAGDHAYNARRASLFQQIMLPLASLQVQEHKEHLVRNPQDAVLKQRFKTARTHTIKVLRQHAASRSEIDDVYKLAEDCRDFVAIATLCDQELKALDREAKLKKYIAHSKKEFADVVFDKYAEEGKIALLLDLAVDIGDEDGSAREQNQGSGQGFQEWLRLFLSVRPNLFHVAWLHYVNMGDYRKCIDTLKDQGDNENGVAEKHTLLSIRKLALLTEPEDDSRVAALDQVNNELDLIVFHDQIGLKTTVTASVLINQLIARGDDQQKDSRNLSLALEACLKGKLGHQDVIVTHLRLVWRAGIERTNWDQLGSLDDDEQWEDAARMTQFYQLAKHMWDYFGTDEEGQDLALLQAALVSERERLPAQEQTWLKKIEQLAKP